MDKKYCLILSETLEKKLQLASENIKCEKGEAITAAIRLIYLLSKYKKISIKADNCDFELVIKEM